MVVCRTAGSSSAKICTGGFCGKGLLGRLTGQRPLDPPPPGADLVHDKVIDHAVLASLNHLRPAQLAVRHPGCPQPSGNCCTQPPAFVHKGRTAR